MSNFAQIRSIGTPIPLALRWSDQDINGHVNNVQILTLLEEARIRATQLWTATTPGETGPRRIIRAMTADFNREVHYGLETTVWVWIPRIGTSSFVIGHLLVQEAQPCVYLEATMVVVDRETGQPIPHDSAYRYELERHVGPPFTRGAS